MERFSWKYCFSPQKLQAKLDVLQGFGGVVGDVSLLVWYD